MTNLWQKAAAFSATKHQGQFRKDGITPYISHPVRVAFVLEHEFRIHDDVITAAALLHDVLEDTLVDYDELLEEFGPDIARIVAAVTKDKRLRNNERETEYDKQLRKSGWQSVVVKLADVYDNICDSPDDDMIDKALAKADRVIDIAEKGAFLQPHLVQPVTKLKDLIIQY